MAQAAFMFDTPVATTGAGSAPARPVQGPLAHPRCGADRSGFEIGWDFAHYRLTPPVAHLHAENPVRQGWSAGRAVFGTRTLRPGRAARQWLQLRLAAWQQGVAFEDVQVTPNFLAQLEVATCPVTGITLTEASGAAADATITRINPAAAVAAGNLAMVSAGAAQAMAGLDFAAASAHARRIEAGDAVKIAGLDGAQWARIALLKSLVTPLPHAVAAELPLVLLPPNRLRVLNPVQALQVMLTLQFCQAGYARRLVAWAALMPSSEARHAFQVFMHTLLARRLAAGPVLDVAAARRAMQAAWADTLVQRRWQRLALRLCAADCEQLLWRAAQRQLLGSGQRWIDSTQATDGWALSSAGQASVIATAEGVVSANAVSH
ncbi:MAG: hypothetical protein HY855_18325 [Burkholderiales bacterium]|nr:hypothetical protein [Burkholderiales bacterium]